MKKYSILFAVVSLVFASLACQTMAGSADSGAPDLLPSDSGGTEPPYQLTVPPVATDDSGETMLGGESEFPVPEGAANVVNVGGILNFQAKMPLDEAMKFYMDAFTKSGYTERSILTVTSDTTFSMVFDGHKSGKAIVVQGVDLGDGTVNVNVSLQDV